MPDQIQDRNHLTEILKNTNTTIKHQVKKHLTTKKNKTLITQDIGADIPKMRNRKSHRK